MQEQIRLLVELQKVDAVIGEMQRKREETPRHLAGIRAGLDAIRAESEQYKAELEELKKDRRTKEGLLQMEIERIHKSEGRLKDIKTQKEYQALVKEVEQGKKLNASREEDILKLISDIEEREKVASEKAEAIRVKEDEYAKEKEILEGELAKIDAEFDGKKREWEVIAKTVKPNILKMYQKVSERRNATTVVPVRNGACTGCHMGLPPQLYNQVQKGAEMYQCPSCLRILYWEGNNS
ncbi:MAG TPA: C4-type zinc ribbon domain-containing protein [Thermodesulfobacteriota bacterium]|nr:C4-type zinc ribbon domain-containing protein [Thermodesulfobacteriota bacterium]